MWIAANKPTQLKTAVFYDLFYNGFIGLPIQMCDVYLFLNRFQAVKRVTFYKRVAIHSFIWTLMTWYWLAQYTIVPFFMNTNTDAFLNTNSIFLSLGTGFSLLYTLYFTIEFALILIKINSRIQTARVSASKIIAIKSVIHCFTSCLANLLFAYSPPPYNNILYNFVVVCNCHLIFNLKIENLVLHRLRPQRKLDLLTKKSTGTTIRKMRSQIAKRLQLPRHFYLPTKKSTRIVVKKMIGQNEKIVPAGGGKFILKVASKDEKESSQLCLS